MHRAIMRPATKSTAELYSRLRDFLANNYYPLP